ncbi:MAG TPA: exodeoxyribonuclease III [Blastocatellia bacterium]|nr:exodeoxyribonuclease III [Blastocatellia bacterium]
MKIATWNINSIAVRLPHVLDWLKSNRPDALCLQEIKCKEDKFPADAFREIGYRAEIFGQQTYNGVATLSLAEPSDVQKGFLGDAEDPQRRLLATTINGVKIVNVYIPNGSEVGSEKYSYKLNWLGNLRKFFDECCDPKQDVVLCGDFNIAPEDRDVHDPKLWAGQILCSDAERAALQKIEDWGLVDVFRQHHDDSGVYTWWDYRGGAFPKNKGLRIDHLWATEPLSELCTAVWVDKAPRALPQPSDHVPVVAEFELE